jgi:hypothetical protein
VPKRAENPTADCLACRVCECKHRYCVYTRHHGKWTIRNWRCRNCGTSRITREEVIESFVKPKPPASPPSLAHAVPVAAPELPPIVHDSPVDDGDPFAPVALDAAPEAKPKRGRPKKTPAAQ